MVWQQTNIPDKPELPSFSLIPDNCLRAVYPGKQLHIGRWTFSFPTGPLQRATGHISSKQQVWLLAYLLKRKKKIYTHIPTYLSIHPSFGEKSGKILLSYCDIIIYNKEGIYLTLVAIHSWHRASKNPWNLGKKRDKGLFCYVDKTAFGI